MSRRNPGRVRTFNVSLGFARVSEPPDPEHPDERLVPEGECVEHVLVVEIRAYTPKSAVEQLARRLSSS